LFSNPPEADDNRNDYTAFYKNVTDGISGCRQKRSNNETFLNNHFKAQTYFCISPSLRAGKSKPPALRVVVDASNKKFFLQLHCTEQNVSRMQLYCEHNLSIYLMKMQILYD
jgi:hypothetical protein